MLDPQKLPEKWLVAPWDGQAGVGSPLRSPAFADCLLWASLHVPWNSVVATEAGAIPGFVALNASLPWLWVVHSYISWRPGFLYFRKKVINACKSQKNVPVHSVQQIDRQVRESSDPPPPPPAIPQPLFHSP